jgi:hypothetical protein
VETCTTCCLCYTGQTDGLCRSDRWPVPVRPMACAGQTGGQSRSGRWLQQPHNESLSDFSRPWNKNISKTQLARKKNPTRSLTKHELTSNNTTQRHTDQGIHPRQIPQRAHTGQTGQEHRSDRWKLGSSGWTEPAGQLLQIQLLISRFPPRIQTKLWR